MFGAIVDVLLIWVGAGFVFGLIFGKAIHGHQEDKWHRDLNK